MKREDIFKTVARETALALEVEESSIQPSSSLYRDLDAESIDLIDLSFRLERAFKITIEENELFDRKPGADYKPIDTIDQIIDFISTKVS